MSLRNKDDVTTDPNRIINLEVNNSRSIIATTRKWEVTFMFIQIGHEFKLEKIEAVGLTDGKSTGPNLSYLSKFQVKLTPNLYSIHVFNSWLRYPDMMSNARVLDKLEDCSALQVIP